MIAVILSATLLIHYAHHIYIYSTCILYLSFYFFLFHIRKAPHILRKDAKHLYKLFYELEKVTAVAYILYLFILFIILFKGDQ